MPAKWRFKQKQREEKDDQSVTPTGRRHELNAKLHSKSRSYGDTLFVTESRDSDVQAYQSSDQLIVIADDLAADNDEQMDGVEAVSSSVSPERQIKRFERASDEVRDINEASCSSDDSVMLPDVSDTPNNIQQSTSPNAALASRKSQETGKATI